MIVEIKFVFIHHFLVKSSHCHRILKKAKEKSTFTYWYLFDAWREDIFFFYIWCWYLQAPLYRIFVNFFSFSGYFQILDSVWLFSVCVFVCVHLTDFRFLEREKHESTSDLHSNSPPVLLFVCLLGLFCFVRRMS